MLDDASQYLYGLGMVSQVSGANTYYYLSDGLGSTMAIVDGSGTVVKSYAYDVYGKVTSSSGSIANEFDFAGQQTDPTGLQYLRARYYDSGTGTFLSRDPLSTSPGWSGQPYGYGSGNPAVNTDPTGLCDDGSPMCQGADPWANPDGWLTPEEKSTSWTENNCYKEISTGQTVCLGPYGVGDELENLKNWALRTLCNGMGSACLQIGVFRLQSLTGEYLELQVTKDVAQAMKAKRWSAEDYHRIKSVEPFKDKSGNAVWAVRRGDVYDWIVERSDGVIISARKGESIQSAQMAAKAFKWPKGIVP